MKTRLVFTNKLRIPERHFFYVQLAEFIIMNRLLLSYWLAGDDNGQQFVDTSQRNYFYSDLLMMKKMPLKSTTELTKSLLHTYSFHAYAFTCVNMQTN